MVVSDPSIHNIMGGMESTAGVRLHNHRRKLKQRFDIIKKLGQGTYGKVQLGINKETGQEVAIKTIKKAKIETEADLIRIRREIQIMSSVQHPNIIHIYEVFENREKMVLVMEYAAGGELYDYLSERKVLTEDEARRIFRQISTAVYYCHKHKICHRDLKLENILLDEHGSAKIADFGLSNVFDDHRLLSTFCGSPLYASPEIVKGTPYQGPEVDCWSLGVLLYTLVYGAMPFDGSNFKRLVKQISNGDYFEPKKPSPASPLIRDLLTVTPARRANIEKVCSHWWVNETYTDSCLEIAEELANQTPVRLDLLLSLVPPPPEVGSDKLLVASETDLHSESLASNTAVPARSYSVGSLMELDHPSEDRKIPEFDVDKRRSSICTTDVKEPSKRKLEGGISTEDAARGGAKRKDCSRKDRDRSASRRRHRSASRSKDTSEDQNLPTAEKPPETKEKSQTEVMDVDLPLPCESEVLSNRVSKDMDTVLQQTEKISNETETNNKTESPVVLAGIATNESSTPKTVTREKVTRKSVKGSKKPKATAESEKTQQKSENSETKDKNDIVNSSKDAKVENVEESKMIETDTIKVKKKKKKVKDDDETGAETEKSTPKATDKNNEIQTSQQNGFIETKESPTDSVENPTLIKSSTQVLDSGAPSENTVKEKSDVKKVTVKKKPKGELNLSKGGSLEKSSVSSPDEPVPPSRPVERRRSKIFETAEKFNNLLSGGSEIKSPTTEKPKKVFIPGVKVSDYKQAFERKSSLTSSSLPTPIKPSTSKKSVTNNKDKSSPVQSNEADNKETKQLKSSESEDKPELRKSPVKSATQTVCVGEKQIDEIQNKVTQANETSNTTTSNQEELLREEDPSLRLVPALEVKDKSSQQEEARVKKLKDAVEIISNAISGEAKKECDQKKAPTKPPVPVSPEKPKVKANIVKSPPSSPIDHSTGKKTVHVQVGPNDIRRATIQVSTPESIKFPPFADSKKAESTEVSEKEEVESPVPIKEEPKKKSSKVEIILKSATLPRRKSSKAEIKLEYPGNHIPPVEYKTEVSHMVGGATLPIRNQKSEVAFPVAAASPVPARAASVEPEGSVVKKAQKPREHIIPIRFEDDSKENAEVSTPPVSSQARPPVPPLQQQRSQSKSISRQSTQDSDTESTSTIPAGPEPIRKSPREYIIPIAVEGGGYVTPRAGSLEPSEVSSEQSSKFQPRPSRHSKAKRMSSLLSESAASEDEGFNSIGSPFATLQRHSSLNRDSDKLEDEFPFNRMHKLRSSKPSRYSLEHNDSLSSAEEEEDDDDGFELLTAENLFSTLLSRVRNLTQRLNVEDGMRPGFPTSRLMSHLTSSAHHTPSSFFSSVYGDSPSRRTSESSHFSRGFSRDGSSDLGSTPWRRSSRDTLDSNSVLSESSSVIGGPRGTEAEVDSNTNKKQSEESPSSPTYPYNFTPSLARRLQNYNEQPATPDQEKAPFNWQPISRKPLSVVQSLSDLESRPPRRISRTLSAARDFSDYKSQNYTPLARKSSFVETKTHNDYPHYSSSVSDFEDFSYRNKYLSPTRRTLSMLDSDGRYSHSVSRGSSAMSDVGDYYRQRTNEKPKENSNILPPIPHGNQKNVSLPKKHFPTSNSSLSKFPIRAEAHASSENIGSSLPDHFTSFLDSQPVYGVNKNSGMKGNSSSSFAESGSAAGVLGLNSTMSTGDSDSKNINDSPSPVNDSSFACKNLRNQSNIPSLLRFRSSSVSRDTEKMKLQKNDVPQDVKNLESKNLRTARSTPERSILSKFFRHGSEERNTEEQKTSKDKEKKKKPTEGVRKISRFLRPDFFDTPREESEYAKQKEAKKASEVETKKPHTYSDLVGKKLAELELYKVGETAAEKVITSEKPKIEDLQKQTKNKPTSTVETQGKVEPKADTQVKVNGSEPDKGTKIKAKESKSKALSTNKSSNKKIPADKTVEQTESVINKNHKSENNGIMQDSVTSVSEKQNTSSGMKNRFLSSLEKKLDKIRSHGNDSTSTNGKGHIDKAIRSLREQSLGPRDTDICTESNLIKRAVSADDFSQISTGVSEKATKTNNSSNSKLGSKVNSVLGLFRKYEDSSDTLSKKSASNQRPTSMFVSPNNRTQLKYTGSHSDSRLVHTAINKDWSKGNQNYESNPDSSAVSGKVNINENSLSVSGTENMGNTKAQTTIINSENNNLNKNVEENASEVNKILNNAYDYLYGNNTVNEEKTNVRTAQTEIPPSNTDKSSPSSIPIITNTENRIVKRPNTLLGLLELPSLNPDLLKDNISNTDHSTKSKNDKSQVLESTHLGKISHVKNDLIQHSAQKNLQSFVSTPDDSASLLSPVDDSESHSFDSWSVCSEVDDRDCVSSPIPLSVLEDDPQESVIDRIRRKSFYTRFNDIKRKNRKSSSSLLNPSLRDPLANSTYRYNSHENKSHKSGNQFDKSPEMSRPSKFEYNSDYMDHPSNGLSQDDDHACLNRSDISSDDNSSIGKPCNSKTDLGEDHDNKSSHLPRYYGRSLEYDSDYLNSYKHSDLLSRSENYGTHLSRPADFIKERRRSGALSGLHVTPRITPSWNTMSTSTGHLGSSLSPRSSHLNNLSRCRSTGGDMLYGKYNRYKSRNPTDSSLLGAYGSASESSP